MYSIISVEQGRGSSVLYRMSGTGTGAIVHCVISVELILGQ